MTPQKRRAILIGVMVAMIFAAAIWNVRWMMRRRRSANSAAGEHAACKEIKRQIELLRDRPAVASTEALASQELGEKIAQAARKARLSNGPPRDVFPQAGRPVGDTPYLIKPTLLTLREVSLQQLVAFLYHLTQDSGLNVRDLRIWIPHGREVKNVWSSEVTITYLIYKPSSTETRGGR